MHEGNGAEIHPKKKKIKYVLLKRQKMLLGNCCCWKKINLNYYHNVL